MTSLSFERSYPWLYAVAAALLAWLVDGRLPETEAYRAGLLSAGISASAILVGFIATSKSIIMALPTNGVRKDLHDAGFIPSLASYLNQAMVGNLLFCVVNIAGFFAVAHSYMEWFSVVWFGVGTFCAATFWRVGRVMMAILQHPPQ